MRIAIDASRSTVERLTGTEQYSRQLIHHLIELNDTRESPHSFELYFRDKPQADLFPESPHVKQITIPFPRLWTHLRFAMALWQSRPDLTFVPAHTLPHAFPGKSIVTVHDLGYKYFPEAHTPQQVRYLDWSTRHSANRADIVLADSRATARDLQQFYDTPSEKIRVVYPGVDAPQDKRDWGLYAKYNIPFHYFLFIGTLQPRKNIERIVEAYKIWQNGNPESNISLILAGKKGWLFDEAWLDGVENIHVIGYVEEEDKGALIRQAVALVFPSLYEGFGFPVIEAMHLGTPVITSNTSSLPELTDDAAILCDPLSVPEIAASMDLLTDNELLRRKLGVKGMLRAREFTWERAAQQTLAAIDELV
jgi:glycosyltransferase involved in cell wall biosynthesis